MFDTPFYLPLFGPTETKEFLTHLPLVHIYASVNWVSIGSGNGLSAVRRQAITWTSADFLSIRPFGTNFSENSIEIRNFSFRKLHLKRLPAKWRGWVKYFVGHLRQNIHTADHKHTVIINPASRSYTSLLSIAIKYNRENTDKYDLDLFQQHTIWSKFYILKMGIPLCTFWMNGVEVDYLSSSLCIDM